MKKNNPAKKASPVASSAAAPKKKPATEKKKNNLAWYGILLFAFVFILYGQSINYGYVLDDDLVARYNPFVQQGIKGLPKIFTENTCPLYASQGSYRPLLQAHLAIEKEFWGFNPGVSHFFNVLYYAILGVILFVVLCRIFKNTDKVFPFLITLLFLAHPVHTEVVANIKSGDEIFCLIFVLLSILFLFWYLDKAKIIWLVASATCFFLAAASKETGLTFLAVIPLILFYFTGEKIKRISLLTVPYLLASVFFLIIRTVVNHGVVSSTKISPLFNSIVAIPSASERLATKVFVLGKYIFLLFVPYHLSWDYGYSQIAPVGWLSPYVILTVLVYLGLLMFALLKIKSRSVFGFCVFYFLVTISITSNIIVPIGSTMAERFLFVPSLGFCIAIVFLFTKTLSVDISANSKHNYSLFYGITGVLIFVYLLKTIDRGAAWKDPLSLYEAGVKDSPNSARTHGALGNEYSMLAQANSITVERNELFKKALDELKSGLNIYPKDYQAWYNLGVVYFSTGKIEEGQDACKKAISYNPDFQQAYNNLGTSQAQKGDLKTAVSNFARAAELDSNYLDAFSNAAAAYSGLREYKKAAPYYKRCVELNPGAKIHYDRMIENEKMIAQDTSITR